MRQCVVQFGRTRWVAFGETGQMGMCASADDVIEGRNRILTFFCRADDESVPRHPFLKAASAAVIPSYRAH